MTTRKPIRRMTQIQTTKKRTSQNPYKELTNSLIRGGCVSQAHFRVLRLLFFARFFCCTMNIIKWVCGNLREKIERVWVPSIDRTMTKEKSTWIWCWFVKQKCLLQFTIALSFVLSWQVENRQIAKNGRRNKKSITRENPRSRLRSLKLKHSADVAVVEQTFAFQPLIREKKYALNKRSF